MKLKLIFIIVGAFLFQGIEMQAQVSLLLAQNNFHSSENYVPHKQSFSPTDSLLKRDKFSSHLLKAEIIALSGQVITFWWLQAIDAWETGPKPLKNAGENLKSAWTNPPVFDEDPWYYNWLAHPYTGALYYNALRSQGENRFHSWLFSTSQSLIWEFLIEATEEQPSWQDILITSNIGSVLGEFAHLGTLKMKKNGFKTIEKICVCIINPSYVINNGFKK